MILQRKQLYVIHLGCGEFLCCDGGLYRLIHCGNILGRKECEGIGNGVFVIHALYQLHEVTSFLYGIVVPQVLLLAYLERGCILPAG